MRLKYSNFYFVVISIIFFVTLIVINIAQANSLIFSEIMYDPMGSDTGNEWIEVFNKSTSTITIDSNWRFSDGTNHIINSYNGLGEILPESFFVITSNATNFLNTYTNYTLPLFVSSFSLNNTNDTISLLQGSDLIIEQYYYSAIGGNNNGKSIERDSVILDENIWRESYVSGGTPGSFPSIAPINNPPIAVINKNKENVVVGDSVVFDCLSSSDPDGDQFTCFWEIGEVATSSEKEFTYNFISPGIYNINLTVSDGLVSDSDLLILEVVENSQNLAPIINVNSLANDYNINENINFDACSSTDTENDPLSFVWNFGDNSSAISCSATHFYNQIGSYNVVLNVSDNTSTSTWNKNINIIEKPNIVINEILPDPAGSDDNEWIELKNIGNSNVDLNSWSIKDESGKTYIFSADDFDNLILNAGNYFVLERSISDISLNNSNEKLYLFNSRGEKVFEVSYGSSKEDYSYSRFDDGWFWTPVLTKAENNQKEDSIRPNAKIDILSSDYFVDKEIQFTAINSTDPSESNLSYKWYVGSTMKSIERDFNIDFSTKGVKTIKLIVSNGLGIQDEESIDVNVLDKPKESSSVENVSDTNSTNSECVSGKEIIINEILPNPNDNDEEFIELYNPNSGSINLSGWKLNDKSSYFFKLSGVINANSYLLIKKSESKISLNNSNEELKLLNCKDEIVASVNYDKSFKGSSYSYDVKSKEYFWTTQNTPDEENIFDSLETTQEDLLSSDVEKIYDFSEIEYAENKKEVFVSGVVLALPNEVYKNQLYVCAYDSFEGSLDYNYCVPVYSKNGFPNLSYGNLVEIHGTINHLKDYTKIDVKESSDIKFLDKFELPNIEVMDFSQISDIGFVNFFAGFQGKITKLNKKSFYISDGTSELKVKIYNPNIKLSEFKKEDNIYVRGIIFNYENDLYLIPRNQSDISKQEVLSSQEQNYSGEDNKSETVDIDNKKDKKNKTTDWVLGSGLVTSLGFVFRNKLFALLKK